MPKKKIMVVDDDAVIREFTKTVLQKAGYEVATAASDGEVSRWAEFFNPDIFVIDLDMSGTTKWRLLAGLRSKAQFALVPMIFMGENISTMDQSRSFHLSGDSYLRKPVREKELTDAVTETLEKNQKARQVASGLKGGTFMGIGADEVAFRGSLEELGLAALLHLVEMEKMEGILVVRHPSSRERGRFMVQEGRILRAQILENDELKGVDAVCHMMNWSTGEFEFRAGPLDEKDEMNITTTQLLIEAARRFDEHTRRVRRAP